MWALICSFSEDLNSEEEVLILHKEYVVSFWGYESFSLDNFDNSEARAEFKVDDEDTPLSLDADYRFQAFFKKEQVLLAVINLIMPSQTQVNF